MRRLLVLGAGTAGTMVVNKLRHRLPRSQWRITVVDATDRHFYQPGYLFVPFGVALGYWLGEPDCSYGSAQHAVTAFQKANRLGRDGIAGPTTLRILASAARPAPRSGAGRVVEVDLARQIVLVAVDGRTAWVFDASTGARSTSTPAGRYQVFRQVDGYDTGPLGTLYRPKYFNRGIAVHGYPSVPPYPASHGCVRIANAAIDWLWSSGTLPIGRAISVY